MEKHPLPLISPEEAGIPSSAIVEFLEAVEKKRVCLHSFMLIRGGKIAYEANWAPITPDFLHRMYSVSKSFVSVGIGFMVDEGRITLDDRIIDYYPEKAPANPHPYMARTTIRDLLKMSSIHDMQPYDGAKDLDWISCFFDTEPTHLPGTVFMYDTMGTVLCCALIERLTGMTLLEYLRPRLLDQIGFSEDAWCVKTPCGYSWAGSGIMCTARDLAKFALTCMNDGQFEGVQLIPRDYIREATSYQIDNRVNNVSIQCGYGYQFWRMPENGFACVGMGSQLAICLPDRDLMFVTTGDTQEFEGHQYTAYELFYDILLPAVSDGSVGVDAKAVARLKELTATRSIQTTAGLTSSPCASKFSGKTFIMDKNALGFKKLRFDFAGNEGRMTYETGRGNHEISFGFGKQVIGKFPETHYSGAQISVPKGDGYRYAASAAWDTADSLMLYCYIIDDYFGTLKMNFSFREDSVTLTSSKVAEWFLDEYVGFASGFLA